MMKTAITKRPYRRLTVFLFIFFVNYVPEAGAHEYARYGNDRYGFCIDYPSHFKMDPPPDNGDGRQLYDGQGFVLTASGINNALDDTLTSEMRSQTKDFDKVTYRTKGKNWFILSGYKGSDVLYRKTYIGSGAINHLFIQYPARRRAAYASTVTRLSRSFKPGDLNDAH
jgi:hypothetical protein